MYFTDPELDEIASKLDYFSGRPEEFWTDYSQEELGQATMQLERLEEFLEEKGGMEEAELYMHGTKVLSHYFNHLWHGNWNVGTLSIEIRNRLESQGRELEAEALGKIPGQLTIPEVRYEYDETAGSIEELIESVERIDLFGGMEVGG